MIRFADNVASSGLTSMHSASGQSMETSSPTARTSSNCQANAAARASNFLRRLYPTQTAANVSADSGIPATRISKWLIGASGPRIDDTVLLTTVYGPDFLHAVLPNAPAWLDRAVRAERAAKLDQKINALRNERDTL